MNRSATELTTKRLLDGEGEDALRGREAGLFWLGPWLVFSALMGSSIVAAMALIMLAGDGVVVPAVMVAGVVLVSLFGAVAELRPQQVSDGSGLRRGA